jgi:hypothetical protein
MIYGRTVMKLSLNPGSPVTHGKMKMESELLCQYFDRPQRIECDVHDGHGAGGD